jgi:predicted nucleic acid-binding protein
MLGILARGWAVRVPEICDYELRRELIRIRSQKSLDRLDELREQAGFLPINPEAMKKAAEYWAAARNGGYSTSDPKALDGDVILAGQAFVLGQEQHQVVVATTNVGHLSRFISAQAWAEIK